MLQTGGEIEVAREMEHRSIDEKMVLQQDYYAFNWNSLSCHIRFYCW